MDKIQVMTPAIKSSSDILSHFHEPTFFPNQREILLQIQAAFNNGKKYIILEAGTGTGKGIVMKTTSEWFGSAHILTAQKSLQAQYTTHPPKLPEVKGRNSFTCTTDTRLHCDEGVCTKNRTYFCTHKPRPDFDLDEFISDHFTPQKRSEVIAALKSLHLSESSTFQEVKGKFRELCLICHPDKGGDAEDFIKLKNNFDLIDQNKDQFSTPIPAQKPSNFACTSAKRGNLYWRSPIHCQYWQQKCDAINAPIVVHNYAYILIEANRVGDFGTKTLLGCDEAHNIRKLLSDFVSLTLSIYDLYKAADWVGKPNIIFKDFGENLQDWINFIKQCGGHFQLQLTYLEPFIKQLQASALAHPEDKSLLKQSEEVSKLFEDTQEIENKIRFFITEYSKNPENWVMNRLYKNNSVKSIELKPISVADYTQKYLFWLGDKVILMSATFLDPIKLCKELNIPLSETSYINANTSFDPENAPIYSMNVGKFNNRNFEEHIVAITETIEKILDVHHDQKGIIHCISNKNRDLIINTIKPQYKTRLIIPMPANKAVAHKRHMDSKDPTVLISISDEEGLDLFDESSRFQILTSLPFGALGDAQVKRRQELDPEGYDLDMLIRLIQSLGRSIRSSSDYATSYILPSQFAYYIKKFDALFQQKPFYPNSFAHFKARIKWDKSGLKIKM